MLKSLWAAAGAVALTIGLAGGAMADAPPTAKKGKVPSKEAYKAPEPAKAETYERPHIGNWSGLYFGASIGGYWADVDWSFPTPVNSTTSASTGIEGAILGGHVGIQHQMGRIVIGVEAGWSGTGIFGRDSHDAACGFPLVFSDACELRKIDAIWTIGPRLGLAHDNWLFYVTGGYASGLIHTQIRFGGIGVPPPPNTAVVQSHSDRHDGWFIGGGVEWKLHDRWIVGLEYVHVDLDSEFHGADPAVTSTLNRHVDGTVDIVRARLSFKLGRDDHKRAEPMK